MSEKRAALGTGTKMDFELIGGDYSILPNDVLGRVMDSSLRRVGAPQWNAKEIEFAQTEMKSAEDKVLERMLEADDLTAAVKRTEAELAAELRKVDADRKAMAAEFAELKSSLERIGGERATVIRSLSPQVLDTFERVAQRRNGIAVAEARGGICTICHVRLRPQVFNTVRRNEQIIQCDSCNRILYFVPAAEAPAADSVSQPAQ